MPRRLLLHLVPALALAALAPAATGCGPATCDGLCEATEFCPNGESIDTCLSACRAAKGVAEAADCAGSFQTFLDCTDGADDVCAEDSCVAEAQAYATCVEPHCIEHPGEAGCASPAGRDCASIEATSLEDGCTLEATCGDGVYALTCRAETEGAAKACVCTKDGIGGAKPAYQADFCEATQLETRVAAARAACGWPAQ